MRIDEAVVLREPSVEVIVSGVLVVVRESELVAAAEGRPLLLGRRLLLGLSVVGDLDRELKISQGDEKHD